MPAQSINQAIAARIARGIQNGEVKPKAGTASAEMAEINPSSLEHFTKMEEATKPVISPEALKKVVEYLAKEAEDFQNYADDGASYDVEYSTIVDIIKDSRNNKLQKFWRSLSDKQQMEIYDMILQYLLNKEIKNDPEYFGDQKAQPINYVLTPRTTSIAPKGDALSKMVDKLARETESWMNYLAVDSPEQIDFTDFVDYVIQDPKTNPRIKNYWNSLRGSQQEALFKKVVSVIEKKYGSDDEMYENISLSKMAKKVIKENKSAPLMLNGKEVDDGSIKLSTQDGQPYITAAKYIDGANISTPDLEKLEQAIESQYEGGLRRFAGFNF